MIPIEGRFAMNTLREGVTLQRYLDDVWARREAEVQQPKASAAWPYHSVTAVAPAGAKPVLRLKRVNG